MYWWDFVSCVYRNCDNENEFYSFDQMIEKVGIENVHSDYAIEAGSL